MAGHAAGPEPGEGAASGVAPCVVPASPPPAAPQAPPSSRPPAVSPEVRSVVAHVAISNAEEVDEKINAGKVETPPTATVLSRWSKGALMSVEEALAVASSTEPAAGLSERSSTAACATSAIIRPLASASPSARKVTDRFEIVERAFIATRASERHVTLEEEHRAATVRYDRKRSADRELIPEVEGHRRTTAAPDEGRVVWQFGVHNGFQSFGAECQADIEWQYQRFIAGGTGLGKVTSSGKVVSIDFAAMKQQVEGSSRQRSLHRLTLGPSPATAAEPLRIATPAERHVSAMPLAATGSRSGDGVSAIVPIWEFSVRDGYKHFEAECQAEVEEQYQAFLKGGPDVGRMRLGSSIVLVDFRTMKQQLEGSSRQRNVRRRVDVA